MTYITKENLLYSPGNCTLYPVMTCMGTKSKKECIYVYRQLSHFAVHLKLTQHCKSTIFQLKKKKQTSHTMAQERAMNIDGLWVS